MRYFIELAFKGSNYFGWQVQPDAISVQEVLSKALSTILREEISVVGAGRTDAGVHASHMVAHFDTEVSLDENLKGRLNSLMADDVVVYSIYRVKDDAHARFDALDRSYRYRIILGRNPFELDTTWQIHTKRFDLDKMNEAAQIMLTYTDFKCFSRSKTDVHTYDCEIFEALWTKRGEELHFDIRANRFLRNMVRAIVGTLLEVGQGTLSLNEFIQVIESRDRTNAGKSAPAKGLYLSRINYPKEIIYGV